jgi:FKBP-type peptidyl-prolyl cis-trans isomerase FkpA
MKLFKPTLVAVALFAVAGCQEGAKKEEAKAPVLETEIQKQAYGLGASIGSYMQRNLVEHDKLGLTLDTNLIVRGFVDSMNDKALIEQEEVQALLQNLEQTMKTKQQEMSVKEAKESLESGLKFLEENAKKEGVQVTESGIQYSVITEGEGEKPTATDTVKVHYKGTFLNGETFDSSYDRGEPAVFPLNRVIRGWTEGVQLMSVGSKFKFTIPSDFAYGPNGNPPRIPGNSVLQFEIELLEIRNSGQAPQVDAQPAEEK